MKTRITQLTVAPDGEPLDSEEATHVRLQDEGAGEFVVIAQDDREVRIDPNEWPHIRDAVDRLLGTARPEPEPNTFEAHGIVWTRHKPGDPMPCAPNTMVRALVREEAEGSNFDDSDYEAKYYDWSTKPDPLEQIIGWARV